MSIPFDLAKKMILDIPRGVSIEAASAESGYSVEAIEKFFQDEVGYSYLEFETAAGVMGTTMAPYYDEIFPSGQNFAVLARICEEIDTYGNILKDAEVTHDGQAIWINNSKMNVAVFYTYDSSNSYGLIHFAVNGFYVGSDDALHELDVYGQQRITEDNFYPMVGDLKGTLESKDAGHADAFRVIFKAIPNDYRQ